MVVETPVLDKKSFSRTVLKKPFPNRVVGRVFFFLRASLGWAVKKGVCCGGVSERVAGSAASTESIDKICKIL